MSIQIDDGEFTRLHNAILEKLALARLTASEYRCLLFLFRMTYGWQKKEDAISLSQWAKGTGIAAEKRHNVLRTLQGLVKKGVITTKPNGNNHPATWGFNKNFEQWDAALFEATVITQDNSLQPSVITQDNTTVITSHNSTVITQDNKTVITGDNHQRKERKTKESIKESVAAQHAALTNDVDFSPTPVTEKALTPQQEMYGAICEALGWDYHVIAEREKVRVAQTVKILSKANYTVEDIRRFMVEIWFKDWRWEKGASYPTLEQLRQEIGKLRSLVPAAAPPPKVKGPESYRRLEAIIGATA